MYEEMIDSCTPEELADPALMAANLQSAYLSGEHPSLWDYHEDPHAADAYWTKGKSKGKGKGKVQRPAQCRSYPDQTSNSRAYG